MKVTPKQKFITVGLELEFNSDETSHFSVMLADYKRLMEKYGNMNGGKEWPWLDQLISLVNEARRT